MFSVIRSVSNWVTVTSTLFLLALCLNWVLGWVAWDTILAARLFYSSLASVLLIPPSFCKFGFLWFGLSQAPMKCELIDPCCRWWEATPEKSESWSRSERSWDCVIQISRPQELQLWRLWENSKIGPGGGSNPGNTYYASLLHCRPRCKPM